ncbi:MAG: hypothetical protein ACI92G_003495 [Candidatus Pelagisphaera sp.]|jgi:hypothetical protein
MPPAQTRTQSELSEGAQIRSVSGTIEQMEPEKTHGHWLTGYAEQRPHPYGEQRHGEVSETIFPREIILTTKCTEVRRRGNRRSPFLLFLQRSGW